MKTVIITGISRGLGGAIAKKFLDGGYFVIGTSTSGKAEFPREGLQVVALDLSEPQSIKAAVGAIREIAKEVDILVNNAGVLLEREDEYDITIEKLRKTLEVNLIGTIDFTEQLLPNLVKGGHIVNVSSASGSLTDSLEDPDAPAYRISKAALNMYTKVLAERLKRQEIIVSSVHPGWVQTDMGGKNAPRSPKEPAEEIYTLAVSPVETGQFWYKGKKRDW